MNPAALNLYRQHRAHTIVFTRGHMNHSSLPRGPVVYRTWHNQDTGEYVIHSRPVRRQP